jgi:D-alanyl-D-alanine carboxypeptidase
MKKLGFLLFILLLASVLAPQQAQARHRIHTPHHASVRHHGGAGVDAGASYADIVIDADTGRVVHQTDSDSLRHPASLTKMMTLYLTFQALESGHLTLGQYLPVSENASYQSPSKLGLHAGQHIRVEDAILGLVTLSANDAAVVLGEALGGSEDGFGVLMTRQARALGMTRSFFHNPSGLPDPEQVTTAHDMAVLGDALIHHYPQYYPYFSTDSFTYAGIYHHNHNHLMDRYEGMDGIKTGYIRASGFNLVASAKRDGMRLIGVIFGGHSAVARDNAMAQLLDRSFSLAEADSHGGHVTAVSGEGDSGDADSSDYITLPAKISAIFGPHGNAGTQAVQAQVVPPAPQVKPQPAPAAVAQPPLAQPSSQDATSPPPAAQTSAQALGQPIITPASHPANPASVHAQPTQGQSPPQKAAAVADDDQEDGAPAAKTASAKTMKLTAKQIKAQARAAAKAEAAAMATEKAAVKAQEKADAKAKVVAAVKAKAAEQAAVKPSQKVAMLTPPPSPATSPAPQSVSGWGIQVGAYSDPSIGQQALSDLVASMPDMLNGADPQVQKVSNSGVTMYRARLMALDRKTAQGVCSFLVQHGKSCLTVEP